MGAELAANRPEQEFVTTITFNTTTDRINNTTDQILDKIDALAGIIQNLVSQREEDRRRQDAQRAEDCRLREEECELLATKTDILKITEGLTDQWMKTQNTKINEAITNADTAATKIFKDGLAALTDRVSDDVAAKFAQATTEHEETMRINREACNEALAQIKRYEEQYCRLAKDASQYQHLKAKWEEIEQKANATQLSVEQLVTKSESSASDSSTPDNTTLVNDIIRNQDHVDDTVTKFLDDLDDREATLDRKFTEVNNAAKQHISKLHDKLKEWVEIIKSSEHSKESAVQTCINQMSDVRSAHSTATELATKSVKLVTDQGDLIATLTATVESLTTQIYQLSTRMDNQASLDEARIAQAVQHYLQRGPIAPSGFTEDEFHACVISILHEQYPKVTVERIQEIFEHESEIRFMIEQRLYKNLIAMLQADGNNDDANMGAQ